MEDFGVKGANSLVSLLPFGCPWVDSAQSRRAKGRPHGSCRGACKVLVSWSGDEFWFLFCCCHFDTCLF